MHVQKSLFGYSIKHLVKNNIWYQIKSTIIPSPISKEKKKNQ